MLSAASITSNSASPCTTYRGLSPDASWRGSSSLVICILLLGGLGLGVAEATQQLLHHFRLHAFLQLQLLGFLGQNMSVVVGIVAQLLEILGRQPGLLLQVIGAQRYPVAQPEFV